MVFNFSPPRYSEEIGQVPDLSRYQCHETDISLDEEHLMKGPGDLQEKSGFSRSIFYETQDGIREAIDCVERNCQVVFVSGRAGTGKSGLIEYLGRMSPGCRQVVVAPTGIAAFSLGAQTIHALFHLPVGVLDGSPLPCSVSLDRLLRNLDRLVIDEISMVRADVLDAIDARLRSARRTQVPFGGIQVVMCGDFLQLPPVVTQQDRQDLRRAGYRTPYAFSSRVLGRVDIHVATLSRVWRQRDEEMVKILSWIREGCHKSAAVSWLNNRCTGPHRSTRCPVLLTSHRSEARLHNLSGFERLRDRFGVSADRNTLHVRARAEGCFINDEMPAPAPRMLSLMPGSRVMATRNDPGRRFSNGSLGVVEDVRPGVLSADEAWIMVRFDGAAEAVKMNPATWNQAHRYWDVDRQSISSRVVGRFRQVPLAPGYAMTVHKSQGLSLDDTRVDLGRGTFAPGQLYVALSRARSCEGLSLVRDIREDAVRTNDLMIRFLDWAQGRSKIALG